MSKSKQKPLKIKEEHVEPTEMHEKHAVTLHDRVTLKKQEEVIQ